MLAVTHSLSPAILLARQPTRQSHQIFWFGAVLAALHEIELKLGSCLCDTLCGLNVSFKPKVRQALV